METVTERTITTRSGETLTVRVMTSEDDETVVSAFERLSPASSSQRFFTPGAGRLGRDRLAALVGLHPGHQVLLAFDPAGELVGGVRTIAHAAEATSAEVAVTVADPRQGEGIGGSLLALAADDARSNGLERLTGRLLAANVAAKAMVERAGALLWVDEPGVFAFEIVVDPSVMPSSDAIDRSLGSP